MTFEEWQQRDAAHRQHEEHERWMARHGVVPITPGNADPMEISATFSGNLVTYDWSRKPWEPCVYRNGDFRRLPRKLKKRLKAHVRRREERELAMVARWWNARGRAK